MRAVVLLLLFVPNLAACEKVSRVRECRKLGASVAEAGAALEAAAKANRAADYRAASKRYLELAKQARQTRFKSATGQAAVEEYALALESVAPPVTAYADALEQEDRRAQAELRREIERIARREHAAVGRIDGFCRAP